MLPIELLLGFAALVVGFYRLFKKDEKRPNKSVAKELGKGLLVGLIGIIAIFLYFSHLLTR